MDNTEAEAALLAMGEPLVWLKGPFQFAQDIRATFRDGRYVIETESGAHPGEVQYLCGYVSASPMRGRKRFWGYRPTDRETAKRACLWHATKGNWPRPKDKGWEFTAL